MRTNRRLIGPQGMAGMVALWGASSLIKSRQSGFCQFGATSTQGDTTITAVDMANTLVFYNGWYENVVAAGRPNYVLTRVFLQSATNVRGVMNSLSGVDGVLYFTVVEFHPGVLKSIQRMTTTVTNTNGSTSAAITEVNLGKSLINFQGVQYSGSEEYGVTDPKNWLPYSTLSSSTAFLVARPGTANDITVSAEVVEFF